MQFIAASLGVECNFCRVAGKFDAHDKPGKKIARRMTVMTLAIDIESFNGRKEVTCFTCHRGNQEPVGTPPVASGESEPSQGKQAPPSAGAVPSAGRIRQILERYISALGGAEALHRISSRDERGEIMSGGQEMAIEVYAKAPNRRMSVTRFSGTKSITLSTGIGAGSPILDGRLET